MSGWLTVFFASNFELPLDVARLISFTWLKLRVAGFCIKFYTPPEDSRELCIVCRRFSLLPRPVRWRFQSPIHHYTHDEYCTSHLKEYYTSKRIF